MVCHKSSHEGQNTIIDREVILNLERSIPHYFTMGARLLLRRPWRPTLHVD